MIKSAIALAAAAPFMAAPALAGPYVNIEANAGWTGDDTPELRQTFTLAMKVLSVIPVLPTMFKLALLSSLLTV